MPTIRSNQDKTVLGVWALAGIVLVATALYVALAPTPDLASLKRIHQSKQTGDQLDIQVATQNAKKLKSQVATMLWDMAPEQLGPNALKSLTTMAANHKVKLTSFRPSRLIQADGLTQVPYVLTIDGPFPQVVAFVRDIETEKSKLAVNQIQLASADGASDRVTATVGVVGYVAATEEAE